MGAWIEISSLPQSRERRCVAPHVGAWIEIRRSAPSISLAKSHPTWVRGLKFYYQPQLPLKARSHPTWVRGLKSTQVAVRIAKSPSHPTWVRGLKFRHRNGDLRAVGSHPTWVRGLKYKCLHPPSHGLRKQPCRERLYGLHQEL